MRPAGGRAIRCRAARRSAGQRGAAAVELALAFPVVLILLGNIVDFGLVLRHHAQLAAGVANAGLYASKAGAGVSADALRGVATASSGLSGATATVSAAACYCPAGTPRTLGAAMACTATCSDGAVASKYLTISGSYAYSPLFPAVSGPGLRVLSYVATVMVR